MARLNLSVAVGNYDRTRPLFDGEVNIEGVDPVFLPLEPEEIFWRAFRHAEFDVCELSLSSYTVDRDGNERLRGDSGLPFAGVPAHVDLHPDGQGH